MEFRENHILPTVRIKKMIIEDFKNIHYGEITFNCGRKDIPSDTEADILGIYGQNGSGKTAVIEAIAILKKAMAGRSVSERYSECVMNGAEYAKLSFSFDFQYLIDGEIKTRTIDYSFKIDAIPNEEYENIEDSKFLAVVFPTKIRIFDEVVSASGIFDGVFQKKQDIITTHEGNYPIGPVRKIRSFVGDAKNDLKIDLEVNKRTASKEAKSFIFMDETIELFANHSDYSDYYQILIELKYYARHYIYAVDTRTSGLASTYGMPLNTRVGTLPVNLVGPTRMPQKVFAEVEYYIKAINSVLPSLVPEMELVIDYNEYVSDNKTGIEFKVLSKRKNTIIPLRDESDGIIKLISILTLIIAAYNDNSITVAIDELDAGIYEYLLGEILSGLETYGKGQFIFTSHNLRPLEVLKKENLIFTTTNPDNRYIRLKGIGRTNNLRTLYLREILGNTQDEKIYDAAKKQRMIAAFMGAGDRID